MPALPLSTGKRIGESLKAAARFLCRPMLPVVPDALANRLPFLGQVCVQGPDNLRLRFHTYGPHGKDRIAIKLARRGFWGYEGETTRIFLALAKEVKTVIDVGANTGLFALLAAKANAASRVWAFEPVPFIHEMLRANIQLNQLNNLDAVGAAVADFVGESTFYITRTSTGIPTDSSSCAGFRSDVEAIRLPTLTLDEHMRRQQIGRLDLLKIDAEAAEAKVLRGALQTIQRDRPFLICEVLEDVDHTYLQETMQAQHYLFYHITPDSLVRHARLQGSLNVAQRNYLFVPAEEIDMLADVCARAGIAGVASWHCLGLPLPVVRAARVRVPSLPAPVQARRPHHGPKQAKP